MKQADSSSQSTQMNVTNAANMSPSEPLNSTDVAPPVGITPPQLLAQDAASGRRGAAWRLLYWIMENDPRAVVAVSSLEDDRLAQHLLEFVAVGTWAGKPFVVPPPLRSAHARTRLRTLFLPGSGIDFVRAERILLAAMNDKRPAMREAAAHILGLLESRAATPRLIEALRDPVRAVQMQAIKALGRVRDPLAVPALLSTLRNADEQMGSQIFTSLVQLGHAAIPSLIEASTNGSAWIRWHCIRAMTEINDSRALPTLVQALGDADHSVAWMSAKGLTHYGKHCIAPVLRLLTTAEITPWLVETASYVLSSQYQHNTKLKSYLEPVVLQLHGVAHRVGTPHTAQKALSQLIADGMIERSTGGAG